jgi:MATE family multidrug resistance protein
MTPLRAEVRKVAQLAVPVVGATVGTMLMGVVDLAMVGRVGVDSLAALSLAHVWIFGTFLLAQGLLMGMDPLVSQAHGAGRGGDCGLVLQRGVVLASVISIVMGASWLLTGDFLRLTGQEEHLAAEAQRYARVQAPSALLLMLFVALRQYLQGRELMRPAMWAVLVANLTNVFFNWVLIFGHLGFPALGLEGAGIATALTRGVQLAVLFAIAYGYRLHEGGWTPWTRAALEPRALLRILAVGAPVAVQTGAEVWAFSGTTLIAGRLDPVSVGAHAVTLNLAALAFMFPLGVAQGAATRVGNLIGAGEKTAAQRSAWISIALGAGVMALFALTFVAFRSWLPLIYTEDAAVIAASAAILPIAAAFAVFDGTQVVGTGVLRGMGDTGPAARYNLVGYWVLGLPIGAWLALPGGMGLAGIWWGLALGLAVVATLLLRRLRRRGPATAQAVHV